MFIKFSAPRGFTLIEVLVTVSIIALLTVMGAVSYRQTAMASRDAKRKADLETVRQALVLSKTDTGVYPNGNFTAMLNQLSSGGYISSPQNIVDPKNDATYFYSYSRPTATTFILSAPLEKAGAGTYTLTQP